MVQGSEIQLRPTQARKDKIQGEVHRVQAQGTLSPAEASRLAGKMILLNATVFGRVGAAALRPLYVRAKAKGGRPKGDAFAITPAIAAALRTIVHILGHAEHQRIPVGPSIGPLWTPFTNRANSGTRSGPPHGWGFVARIHDLTYYGQGSVPPPLLQKLTTRKAFIYFLEIYAQVIMAAALAPILPTEWIGFIDNQAGHSALVKGCGSDDRINLLLECFWKFAATRRWRPHFEWVPSHSNISDPISRVDFTLAVQRDWLHVPIDESPLHRLLSSRQTDLEAAHLKGAQVLEALASPRCGVVNSRADWVRVRAPETREDTTKPQTTEKVRYSCMIGLSLQRCCVVQLVVCRNTSGTATNRSCSGFKLRPPLHSLPSFDGQARVLRLHDTPNYPERVSRLFTV